mmetsp:Transcript_4518/g.16935  ORF Transcript_4518/g.16935 Transcript_4518/m.16935 type:complete len:475 (+) Transcript_4518:95-1519(+)
MFPFLRSLRLFASHRNRPVIAAADPRAASAAPSSAAVPSPSAMAFTAPTLAPMNCSHPNATTPTDAANKTPPNAASACVSCATASSTSSYAHAGSFMFASAGLSKKNGIALFSRASNPILAKKKKLPARLATPPNPASDRRPHACTCGVRTSSKRLTAPRRSSGIDSIAVARYCAVSRAQLAPCPRDGQHECAASPAKTTDPSAFASREQRVVTPPLRHLCARICATAVGGTGAPLNASGNSSSKSARTSSSSATASQVHARRAPARAPPWAPAWAPPGRMITPDSVPAGSGGASMLTKPRGQVWKHLAASSPSASFRAGSLTVLNIISSAFCVTRTSPPLASMDRTALLTPSAATSRSYGADTHASSSSWERSSDGASDGAKTATRRAKSTSRTPYPRVNSMRSGCLVAAVDAMASDSASLFTATVPLNCLDTAGAAPGRCRTFPTIRTTRSSGNVTPAPASAFIPLGESTTL